jgi:predicted dinucleotide-binding enzyme
MQLVVCVLAAMLAFTAAVAHGASDSLSTVAIIGSGKVGGALGTRLAESGYKVIYGSRNPSEPRIKDLLARSPGATAVDPARAARTAPVLVLAVPWTSAQHSIETLGDLSGTILIDPTNPVAPANGRDNAMPVSGSGAQMIQSWARGARVVKAFNTTNWSVLGNPAKVSALVTIPLAGDDAAAKAIVAKMVSDLGFTAADAGPLINAHYLEEMAMLYISVLLQDRPDAFEFALIPRTK